MRNDDRLFDVLHLVVDAMHAMQPATMLFAYRRTGPRRSALIATTHVGARAEVAAGGADQHHLQRWRVAEVIQRGIEQAHHLAGEIGRASCRERVCQYVYISVVAVSLKKKQTNGYTNEQTMNLAKLTDKISLN